MRPTSSLLARVPLFSQLTLSEQAELSRYLVGETFPAGAVIFTAGDPGDTMYIIGSGHVAITVEPPKGPEVTLTVLGPGEYFGELSLLDGEPRSATARTLERTTLHAIRRPDFLRFFFEHPGVAQTMLRVLGARLRATDEMMRSLVARDVNREMDERLTFGDRLADRVATFAGSWTFIIYFVSAIGLWMAGNVLLAIRAIDPYPYLFLNLVLGVVAASQAPFIMMSQNRQAQKDRLRAEADYQLNLKNEVTLQRLSEHVDRLAALVGERMPQEMSDQRG